MRIQNNLTQDQMKDLLGLKYKSHYCQIEKGEIKVSLELARNISNIFGTSIEEIFFDNKVHETRTKNEL